MDIHIHGKPAKPPTRTPRTSLLKMVHSGVGLLYIFERRRPLQTSRGSG